MERRILGFDDLKGKEIQEESVGFDFPWLDSRYGYGCLDPKGDKGPDAGPAGASLQSIIPQPSPTLLSVSAPNPVWAFE